MGWRLKRGFIKYAELIYMYVRVYISLYLSNMYIYIQFSID